VAKILVADDNSNIQKMVGLALKDQGIDVVAVGNGEAAVRKISDVRPDLVLADVFMPVRNGYEVCKYVKDDSALSHIPVILLVGAFDPLDEQEAQRVGADGVLKKPFVPPDPLISMVKSALSRAGVLPSDRSAETSMHAAEMISPRAPEIPTLGAVPAFGDFQGQGAAEATTRAPEPVRMDSVAPVAFGSLLETPVTREEEDLSYLQSTQRQMTPDRTWGASDEPEEVEVEEEQSSWRRGGEELDDAGIAASGDAGDWRDTVMADAPTRRSARESWEPTHELNAVVDVNEEPAVVTATESLHAPTPISAGRPTAAPSAGDAWAAPTSSKESKDKSASVRAEAAPVVESAPIVAEVATSAHEPAAVEENQPDVAPASGPTQAESWFAPAPNPWDAELKKASELAAGWDSPKASPEPTVEHASLPETTLEAAAQEAGLPSSAVDEIREEAALVTETAPASKPGTAAPASERKMDDLVAKVLAKLSPDVLQAVTREILKPVVEAMVRDELNSKKP